MKKLLAGVFACLLFTACGGAGGSTGATLSNVPTKLVIKRKDMNGPEKTMDLDGKKTAVVTTKTKFGYAAEAPELVTQKILIANYDFDPKAVKSPAAEGQILITIPLYAAKDAAEGAPLATGTYEPSKSGEPGNAYLKVGDIRIDYYTIENGTIKMNAFEISKMGIRNGSIKITAVAGDQVQGTIDDFGAGQFSNIKGTFTATVVK